MHTIRLRGPWEFQPIDSTAPPSRFDWLREIANVLAGRGTGERIRLLRGFTTPTGIEPGDQIELVVSGLAVDELRLNSQQVLCQTHDPSRYLITDHLLPRNQLEIWLPAPAPISSDTQPARPDVRLEILPGTTSR